VVAVMLHEEWVVLVVERLGIAARTASALGDGETLRGELTRLERVVTAWRNAASAPNADVRLAIEATIEDLFE